MKGILKKQPERRFWKLDPRLFWGVFPFVMVISLLFVPRPVIDIANAYVTPGFDQEGGFSILGFSPLGESVVSLLVWGYWQTLMIAAGGRLLAVLFGGVGLWFAWMAGKPGSFLVTRFSEALMTIPSLLLALSFGFVLGNNFTSMVLVIALSEWAFNQKWLLGRLNEYGRMTYVTAAKTMGADRLMLFHIHYLPLLLSDMKFLFIVYLPGSLLTVAALEFLGFSAGGVIPGLGYQIAFNKELIFLYPHVIVPSLVVIVLTVLHSYGWKNIIDRKSEGNGAG